MSRTTLIRLATGGAALLIAFLAYGFWYANVIGASAKAAELGVEINTDSARATRVAAAKAALATLAEDEGTIGQYFISSATLVPFLESLQSTGDKLGATVTVSSVSADTKADRPELSVNGSVVGSFDSVMRFIGTVEYAPYYVTVENLSLSSGNAAAAPQTGPAVWTATFLLTVGSETPITTNATGTPPTAPVQTPVAPPVSSKPTPQA